MPPRNTHPNQLLAALQPTDFARLEPHLKPFPLVVHADIELPNQAFARVVFPSSGLVSVVAHEEGVTLDTTIIPTGRRRVPVAFGWHPYLRLPGPPRSQWQLRLPPRTHLALDDLGLPTGAAQGEARESEPIGRRTFDDLYLLGRERRLAFVAEDGTSITLRCGPGYPYAQVWVPRGQPFGALEPMTVATNSLVAGTTPLVEPGDAFTARFTLAVGAP